ncbi:MAG: aminotransferase class V-fold PLP-dependent enzyme [Myxococcaceae bacterium]
MPELRQRCVDSIPPSTQIPPVPLAPLKTYDEVARFLRHNEVGRRACIETPFGRRLLCYADMTASGRFLHFVEAWMRRVAPFYANTHTAISSTGRIMTELREKSRAVVRRSVNAGQDDVVLFVGSGATAAVNKLVGLLGLRIDEPLEREYALHKHIPPERRPVVLVGPYEHHSNELPWLESVAEVVEVALDASGCVDLSDLDAKAREFSSRPLRIGSFSAASNVTGVLTDVPAVTRILRKNGFKVCFDYAAAGPYVPIDMHPKGGELDVDAVYLSMHKFIGGPQASGVLVAHRDLFRTRRPERPGGGTVEYVAGSDRASVDYTHRLDEREEGGTPAIVSDLRAGISFLVKDLLGAQATLSHECEIAKTALTRLSRHPRIQILGSSGLPRLPILSFNVQGLHHDLVSVLLDQLFGIQNRAGCSCAGPYGHKLLGIDDATSRAFREQVAKGRSGIKRGWVRVTLPSYASSEDIDFIMKAIEFLADHGRDFVPMYRLSWRDGVWRHIERPVPDVPPLELTVEALLESAESFAAGDHEAPLSDAQMQRERARYFQEADRVASQLRTLNQDRTLQWNAPTGDADIDRLRWFDYVHTDALDAV